MCLILRPAQCLLNLLLLAHHLHKVRPLCPNLLVPYYHNHLHAPAPNNKPNPALFRLHAKPSSQVSAPQPAGSVVPASGQPTGSVVPISGQPAGSSVPASGQPTGSIAPASGQPAAAGAELDSCYATGYSSGYSSYPVYTAPAPVYRPPVYYPAASASVYYPTVRQFINFLKA